MSNQSSNKIMNILLWVAQSLVALMLIWGAYAKLTQPVEQLSQMMPWAAENPTLVTFTGIVDLLGGVGLILPALLKIKPQFTIYAAVGTALLMLSAIFFHVSRGETPAIGFNIVLLLLAVFIAWGRSKKAILLAR